MAQVIWLTIAVGLMAVILALAIISDNGYLWGRRR